MVGSKALSIAIAAIIIILLLGSFFTVSEGENALLLKLGRLESDAKTNQAKIFGPGLHFKLPIIESVESFDTRLQTLDISTSRIVTAEKKDVIVDYYVKWRIKDLALFYTRTGNDNDVAGSLLQQQLNDSLSAQFGKRTINDVVSAERSKIMDSLLQQANAGAQTLGIEVLDVRIKRIDLPAEVSASVFNRMRAERERVATEHRSLGQAAANAIRANADANVTVAIAQAEAQAAQIQAKGLAQAAQIYAEAYSKDAGFYAFYRSLKAYQNAFKTKNNILVLKPDNQFFRYFNGSNSTDISKKTQ